MAQAAQKYKSMHPLMRSMQKRDAKKMLAQRPPAADPVADAVAEVKKNLETVLITKEMTPEQRQAIAAGAARAWYAAIPGAATELAGMIHKKYLSRQGFSKDRKDSGVLRFQTRT